MDRAKDIIDRSDLILELIKLNCKEDTLLEADLWIRACLHVSLFVMESLKGKDLLAFKKSYLRVFQGIAGELEKEIKELSNSSPSPA